jgi:hypothetical protein
VSWDEVMLPIRLLLCSLQFDRSREWDMLVPQLVISSAPSLLRSLASPHEKKGGVAVPRVACLMGPRFLELVSWPRREGHAWDVSHGT